MLSAQRLLITPSLALSALLAAIPLAWASSNEEIPHSNTRFTARDCQRCHAEKQAPGLNHPLGVQAGAGLGAIDCLSCHKEASTRLDHTQGGSMQSDALLKATSPRQLCTHCHKAANQLAPASALSHGLALGRAHLSPSNGVAAFGRAGLDQETRACLSCHDGNTASSAGVREHGQGASLVISASQRIRSMHPIGVRYDWVPKGTMAPQFQPEQRLPDTIRLFKGKLGCGSCHTLYGHKEQMLAQDPKRGRLCLSCHIK